MSMSIKKFFNLISRYAGAPALPSARAASVQLVVQRSGVPVEVQGRMDGKLVRFINEAKASLGLEVDAVVLSYATPIAYRAWFNAHNHAGKRLVWIVAKQRHSATTTRHQNQLRANVGQRLQEVPWQLEDMMEVADIHE
jgi:hypothetical protein